MTPAPMRSLAPHRMMGAFWNAMLVLWMVLRMVERSIPFSAWDA